jgi:hypothetical protein
VCARPSVGRSAALNLSTMSKWEVTHPRVRSDGRPLANKKLPASETKPATQQIDFYIRRPQQKPKNRPNRQVFLHFFGMEITWK